MSNHTPGPWQIVRDERDEEPHDPIEIFAGEYCVAAAIADGYHYDAYADDELFLPVVEANARLIAAAPELLDTLIAALPYVEMQEGDEHYKPGAVAKILKKMRAAISQAEGR